MDTNTTPQPMPAPASIPYPQTGTAARPQLSERVNFIVFGASGDLTHRKLIPALYNLTCAGMLPTDFRVIGFAFTPMDDAAFREEMRKALQECQEATKYDPKVWETFERNMSYITADFLAPDGYEKLKEKLKELGSTEEQPGNRLFYLATSPSFYADIVDRLGAHGLVTPSAKQGENWTRIIIEKPFGHDLDSAQQLNIAVHKVFSEEQVYRIDHYLGKETVQNIMAFRFANSIIDPIWNRRYVDHVQITAAETLGVEHRGKYYEEAGCLRDMFQNHLLQLMSIIAMDPPVRYGGTSARDRKADVLKSIVPINPEALAETAVRGQYGPGVVDGENVPGYREEEGVNPNSNTETYVALKLFVDNWRWADVPFYLRSGKRLPHKVTEIVIQFKRVPHLFFHLTPEDQMEPNLLVIRIQPDEGISLRFGAKVPGPEVHIRQVQMNFSYADAFKVVPSTAYETLLLDAMEGDPSLFNRADAVELAWTAIAPLLDIWKATKPFQPFPNYGSGTWGPSAADALLARDGRSWHNNIAMPVATIKPEVAPCVAGEPVGVRRAASDGETDGNKPGI